MEQPPVDKWPKEARLLAILSGKICEFSRHDFMLKCLNTACKRAGDLYLRCHLKGVKHVHICLPFAKEDTGAKMGASISMLELKLDVHCAHP